MGIIPTVGDLTLADGTGLCRGDRIIDLHLWNEQFPRMAARGPTLGWAGRVNRAIDQSLRELAWHLASRRDLDDVRVIRVCLSTDASNPASRLPRLMARYGFEAIAAQAPVSLATRLHRLGQNVLVAALVLASNPATFRARCLWHGRTEIYLSRRYLEARYGAAPQPARPCLAGSPR